MALSPPPDSSPLSHTTPALSHNVAHAPVLVPSGDQPLAAPQSVPTDPPGAAGSIPEESLAPAVAEPAPASLPLPAPSAPPLPSPPRPSMSEARSLQEKDGGRPISSPSSSPPTDTSKPNGNGPSKLSPGPQKNSVLSKLLRALIPCAFPSATTHQLDLDIDSITATGSKEKAPSVSTEPAASNPVTSSPAQKDGNPALAASEPTAEQNTLTLESPLPSSEEIFIPPTPPPRLLPLEETEGVTSGAVQPPGSSGDTPVQESKRHSRDSTPPSNASTKESDASSFTEDDDIDGLDDLDIEDKLIMNGGAGIPIGPDGIPKPLLPPIAPKHAGRKCLVLDLDETLVHSSFKSIQQADYVVPVEIEYNWHNVYVIKRPGVDNFLKKMGELYEVVVFTASLSKYADPVLDKLDIHQVVSHRLFRESCYNHKGNYVKDLSQLGRPITDTIILDNSPASYIFHPNNAVPVSSWFNDPHDTELTDLVPFLTDLSSVEDVRGVLDGAR